MTDPNGATVRSQTVPSGYAAKEGDVYTYSIVDLTRFNERYNCLLYTSWTMVTTLFLQMMVQACLMDNVS